MKKGTERKAAVVLAAVILIFFMAACDKRGGRITGKTEETIDETDRIFEQKDLILKEVQEDIGTAFVFGDRIYFTIMKQMDELEEENTEDTCIYSMSLEGTDVKELSIPKIEADENYYLTADEDGNLVILFCAVYGKWSCSVLAIDGKTYETTQKDITESIQLSQGEYLLNIMSMEEGLAVATNKRVLLLDLAYKLEKEILSVNGEIQAVVQTKTGDIFCGINGENEAQVYCLDVKKEKWSKPIPLEIQEFHDSDGLKAGRDYDFYYGNDEQLYAYDMDENRSVRLVNYEDAQVENPWSIVPITKDKLLGTGYGDSENLHFVLYSRQQQAK